MDRQADLKAYYQEEARQRSRKELRGPRLKLRADFLELLKQEDRVSIVDFGSGPGRDALGFAQAGYDYLGIDLAPANAALAGERGLLVVPGSVTAPPLRAHSFDAGWSMSTLMHLPAADIPDATAAMANCLVPGAPFLVGLWGGDNGDHIDDTQLPGQRRYFGLRSPEENRELFQTAMSVEREDVWAVGDDDWHYQVFLLRKDGDRLGAGRTSRDPR